MKLIIFTFCLNIIFNIRFTSACKGCIEIGEFNFDKIIPRFEAVLVKFDVAYPFGEQHDIFAKVAEEIIDNKNFILAQLPMKDYGEKENEDFAKKYGVTKEDLPALRLFVQGEDEPFIFDKNLPWTEENVKKFVKEHTNIYLGLPGCLEAFDKLAAKFIAAKNRDKVLQETEKEAKKLTTEREKGITDTYIKFMKKVVSSGSTFVKQELARLEKILKEGKVNQKKKEELSHRSNILKSFVIKPEKSEL